jgi:hypothetical protein
MTSENEAPTHQTNISTGGGDYAEGGIDKRQGEIFVDAPVYGDVIREQRIYYQPATTPLDRQQQRNRKAMLQKVKAIWIDGLLEQSLAKELRLALDLTTQPDAVTLPLNALVQELNQPVHQLPVGTSIFEVFEQMGGALLILGAPGAGKTTLLLELCRDLIALAEQDEGYPIPVVFSLATWASNRQPLKTWLVEELNQRYDVPRKQAHEWVEADAILPLLDGLDEAAAEHRNDCVEAINSYRLEHGLVPLVVCSRIADYKSLTAKLRLQGAVVVQPLTPSQVDTYFERAGEKLVGVQAALRDDTELGKMLDTPLMLSIVALAYAGKSEANVQASGTPEKRRYHLFDAFIAAMFKRHSQKTDYTPQQTTYWLSWLARQMVKHSQTVYYIERMQPNWLLSKQSWIPTTGVALFCIVASGLLGGLFGGVLGNANLLAGLGSVLVGGLLGGLGSYSTTIESVETLHWRWSREILLAQLGRLVIGLLAGVTVGLVIGQISGLFGGLFVGLFVGLSGGLSGSEIETKTTPNQGIHRSNRTALIVGLFGGLVGGLVGGLFGGLTGAPDSGFIGWLLVGLGGGLGYCWLIYGGRAVLQHYTLRWLLSRNDGLPLRDKNLVPFLDYCVERIFLRKVGGGYIFVHRLLMEHFVSLYDEQARERDDHRP